MKTKTCTKCKRDLPITQFQADKRRLHGVGSHCRDCKRAYRQENSDKLLVAQYERRARKKNELSLKRKAWNALYYALKVGKVEKPNKCAICGTPVDSSFLQGHHEDYTKPFDVIWCCQDCHVGLDKARLEVEYACA